MCNGDSVEDNCGTCDNDATNDCTTDCNGEWGGHAGEDNCGTCEMMQLMIVLKIVI